MIKKLKKLFERKQNLEFKIVFNNDSYNEVYNHLKMWKDRIDNRKFNDFYEAFWFLEETPVFMPNKKYLIEAGCPEKEAEMWSESETSFFNQSLTIEVQKVCPKTRKIMKNKKRNTHVEVWLECGEPHYDVYTKNIVTSHNWEYDCGGDTFEEAIINLANIVYEKNKELIDETSI